MEEYKLLNINLNEFVLLHTNSGKKYEPKNTNEEKELKTILADIRKEIKKIELKIDNIEKQLRK